MLQGCLAAGFVALISFQSSSALAPNILPKFVQDSPAFETPCVRHLGSPKGDSVAMLRGCQVADSVALDNTALSSAPVTYIRCMM